jgi:hypothetical protein
MPTEGLISGFAFRVQRRSRIGKTSPGPGAKSTNPSVAKPQFRIARRITVGWKAQ